MFTGIIFIIFALLKQDVFNEYLLIGFSILSLLFIIWIKNQFSLFYKERLKEKLIKDLENELEQEKNKNKTISENLDKIATINHKYSSRISALENWSKNIVAEEFSTEISDITNSIKNISYEYSNDVSNTIMSYTQLPKTNIATIDNLLKYLQEELMKDKINFDFKFNNNDVNLNLEQIISISHLETLLCDLIKNAQIAINYSNKKYRAILLKFESINNKFEISISDNGIPFEIDTLLNLGTKPSTTHKDGGGSGIGYMTIFEILNIYKASLIIKEYSSMTGYKKTIVIRFDTKNKYIINSYRYKEMLEKNTNDKIIIEKI